MIQRTTSAALVLLLAVSVHAQYVQEPDSASTKKDPRPLKDRLYFGGGASLQFGNFTNIGIAPRVGYKVDQKGKWSIGLGADYQYFSFNDNVNPTTRQSIYGGSLFSRYRILPQFFLSSEFQLLSYERAFLIDVTEDRAWIPFLYLGGGYSARIGGNSYFVAQIAWDVIRDSRLFYNQRGLRGQGPITNVGFSVGF